MRKVVSLFLPSWPTDRLRRQMGSAAPPPAEPLVLSGRDGAARTIQAADLHARRLGLHPGLPIAQARARVPCLHVLDADPEADHAALARLAAWCLKRYSPIIALDPPDGLWIDATGAGHLFGGDRAMLDDLARRLDRSGIAVRAAMADTPGAAHALARHGYQQVAIADRQVKEALGVLPIAALRLPDDMVLALRKLGFAQIGDLARTARAPLALRFGALIGRRLDQMFGHEPEPFDPVAPAELVRAERVFAEPIDAPEILQRQIGLLADGLCATLRHRALGARRLDLLFHRVDAAVLGIRVGTAAPCQDPRHLARLLADRLETVDPGFGVERMTLTASLAEPVTPRQASSLVAEASLEIGSLIDTLANRLGMHRLYRAVPVESDLPERSVGRVAALAPAHGGNWPEGLPRPSRLLAQPEPVETMALLPDHPPAHFTWRGIRRQVVRADGPERVFGEWWHAEAEHHSVRDYFQVEDQAGERFWLFRSGDGTDPATGSMRWYLHGIFA
jgi:protein ImuB